MSKKSFFFLMEDNKPKQSPPKNFQEEVVDAIVKGDLAAFKKCCVGKNDINRRLLPHKELKPVPKYNKDQRYINIKGPTMLMFAILCEQDEIVEYILDNKNPDVSKPVEGYKCLHLAAMVKDPRCLKLLLQHAWIQENIDDPIELLGTNAQDNEKTTALHVAVSNRRYANAILLKDHFPKPRWFKKKDKKPKDKDAAPEGTEQPEENKETIEEEEDVNEPNETASINQKSASGSTPLYIAVFLRDYKMVRILLSCEADPSIPCAKDVTPLQLALDMQAKNKEKKEKIQAQQTSQKKKSKPETDDIDLIVTALQNADSEEKPDTLDILKKELAPELLDKKEENSSQSSDEEAEEDEGEKPAEDESKPGEAKPEKEKKKQEAQSVGDKKIFKQLLDQIKQLNARLTLLESQKGAQGFPQQPPPSMHSNVSQDSVCSNCGAAGAKLCPQCHRYFCDLCFRKQLVHKCTV